MGKFIEKLDSYELMTSLLPGTFFCISLRIFCGLEFPTENMVEEIVIYYFVGLIINRVGSIIVKPCLLKVNVIKDGKVLGTLNKDTLELEVDSSKLIFETTKPKAEGDITLTLNK